MSTLPAVCIQSSTGKVWMWPAPAVWGRQRRNGNGLSHLPVHLLTVFQVHGS